MYILVLKINGCVKVICSSMSYSSLVARMKQEMIDRVGNEDIEVSCKNLIVNNFRYEFEIIKSQII